MNRFTRLATTVMVVVFVFVLGACGEDSDEPADGSTTGTALAGDTYSTTAFVVPFDVTVPDWLPAEVTTDAANFVTWDTQVGDDPAVRFLVPVDIYRPGDAAPTSPPEDQLAHLLSLSEYGATFTDSAQTTVGGEPATLVTASATDALDGTLGCPAHDLAAPDCYGLQPELALRIAVIDLGDITLVAWLRHSGAADTDDAAQEFAAFEEMLGTVSFRDEAPPTADPTETDAATDIDGTWTTSFTEEELASSSLLYEPDEVNDQNWGDFTFSLKNGEFTFDQTNPKDEYSMSGTFIVDGGVLRLALANGEQFAMRYSIESDQLTFERDDAMGVSPTPFLLKPWTRR
jgi:hypothetical protein